MSQQTMKRYTESHLWLQQRDDGVVRVGISDYAQEQLGDVVFADLPSVGQLLSKGRTCAIVESVKTASDIEAPLDGEITAVNSALAEHPELLNDSPEEQGWLLELTPVGDAGLDTLMDPAAYRTFTR